MIGWGQVTGRSLAGPFELKLYLSECHKCKAMAVLSTLSYLSSLRLGETDTALGRGQTRWERLWAGRCSGERVPFFCGGLRISRLKGELGMPAGLRAARAAQS